LAGAIARCQRLYEAVADQGVAVESQLSWVGPLPKSHRRNHHSSWECASKASSLCPHCNLGLRQLLLPCSESGGRSHTDCQRKRRQQVHVPGDIAVTPYVLLKPAISELQRLLEAMKDREIWVMDVIPKLLLVFCCEDAGHCASVRLPGPEGLAAAKKTSGGHC
jgi:hypothetical protein